MQHGHFLSPGPFRHSISLSQNDPKGYQWVTAPSNSGYQSDSFPPPQDSWPGSILLYPI